MVRTEHHLRFQQGLTPKRGAMHSLLGYAATQLLTLPFMYILKAFKSF